MKLLIILLLCLVACTSIKKDTLDCNYYYFEGDKKICWRMEKVDNKWEIIK